MDALNNYMGPTGGVPPVMPFAGVNSGTPVIPETYWNSYDDEQRIKLLWKCFGSLANLVNQLSYYYIPNFDGEWSATKQYPPLTVVSAPAGIEGVTEGDSYTAIKLVPVGTPLTDTQYWALTGNYNAQIAAVQNAIVTLQNQISSIYPLDSEPAQSSTKGITSGAVYDLAQDLNNDVSEINKSIDLTKEVIVCGDSFTYGSVGNVGSWCNSLPSMYTVHNHSRNGAGFTNVGSGGANFIQQLQEAHDNNETAGIIIAYGGYNDIVTAGSSATQIYNAINQWYDYARQNWPDSRVIIALGNPGIANQEQYINWPSTIYQTFIGIITHCYCEIYDAQTWLMPWGSNAYQDDNLHPNSTGVALLTNRFASILNGGKTKEPIYNYVTSLIGTVGLTSTTSSSEKTISISNCNRQITFYGDRLHIHITGSVTLSEQTTAYETFKSTSPIIDDRSLSCIFGTNATVIPMMSNRRTISAIIDTQGYLYLIPENNTSISNSNLTFEGDLYTGIRSLV